MPLAEILLVTACLLTIAMLLASLRQQLILPYTVLLVLLGILVDMIAPYFAFAEQLHQFKITPDIVLYLFLPALIFESAISLDARALLKNIAPILVLAIPGMLVSCFLVGSGLWMALNINFLVALIFGALISATDPVAVIELFKKMDAPTRLTVLVEGESLMNDATAIVLFHLLLAFIVKGELSLSSSGNAIIEFSQVFIGGVLIGSLIGLLAGELVVKLATDQQGIPIILTLAAAYSSFIIAEHQFHVSGVMSVLATAICLNIFGIYRLPQQTTKTIHTTWDVIVLICNSLLFILIGLSVAPMTLVTYWQPILIAAVAVLIARAVSVYLIVPLTMHSFTLPRISLSERHIMWWGGLKGGLAIAIALSIPESMPERDWLIELTLGVVLFSLLVSGSTLKPMIHWLKIDALTTEEQAQLKQGLADVNASVSSVLHSFSSMHLLDREMHNSVRQRLAKTLKRDTVHLSEEQLLHHIHLQALQAEEEELIFLYEISLVNDYVYLTFKDIIRRDKEQSYADLLNAKHDVGFDNSFLQMENILIEFLVEKKWLHGLLVRYQNIRFANQVRHDIAGVLMAHRALKAIKNSSHNDIREKKLDVLKTVYKLRLKRRQSKLKSFSSLYPEFFQQYEYLLFLQAAIRYSMKLLAEENAAGKISNKVYSQIQSRLQDSERQLPLLEASLTLRKRDTWLNQIPLFSGLSKPLLKQLASNSRYVNFLPGDIIFHEHDKGSSLYILVKGKADVFRKDSENNNIHLAELREGSLIGLHALLAEKSVRSVTVIAKTYVTLLLLPAKEVLKLASDTPDLERRLHEANLML
jgi:Na+:H+ antiporter